MMSLRSGPVQSGLSLTDYQLYYLNTTVIINKCVINHVPIKRKFGRANWGLSVYLLNVGPSMSEAGC